MEYTIYNETLLYYALRNPETGKYLGIFQPPDEHCQSMKIGMPLKECVMYKSLKDAQDTRKYYPEFSEIRKVKVIDIGEVDDN